MPRSRGAGAKSVRVMTMASRASPLVGATMAENAVAPGSIVENTAADETDNTTAPPSSMTAAALQSVFRLSIAVRMTLWPDGAKVAA